MQSGFNVYHPLCVDFHTFAAVQDHMWGKYGVWEAEQRTHFRQKLNESLGLLFWLVILMVTSSTASSSKETVKQDLCFSIHHVNRPLKFSSFFKRYFLFILSESQFQNPSLVKLFHHS